MREIKFRAWNTAAKIYYPLEHFAFRLDGLELQLMDRVSMSYQPNFGDAMIYEQYTGLKDKNGVEIYEGDICEQRFDNRGSLIMQVIFNQDTVSYEFKGEEVFDSLVRGPEYEVIGNIHENPDLLQP